MNKSQDLTQKSRSLDLENECKWIGKLRKIEDSQINQINPWIYEIHTI